MSNHTPYSKPAFMAIDVQRMFCDAAFGEHEAEDVARKIVKVKALFNVLGVPSYLFMARSKALEIPPGYLDLHLIKPTYNEEVFIKTPDENSAFAKTNLANALREEGIKRLYISGFTTPYCVRATVQDACNENFEVTVLTDCIASARGHSAAVTSDAMKIMRKAGAWFMTSQNALAKLENFLTPDIS